MTGSQRVLIAGATGLLGPYLVEAAAQAYREVDAVGHRHGTRRCDLADVDAVHNLVDDRRYDIVVNAAAFADVEACQDSPDRAERVNIGIVRNMVQSLPDAALFVQISTDQVYPDTLGPHVEDEASPVNVYGATKFAGELAALDRENTLVLRTNFFGVSRTTHRRSLSDWALDHLAAHESIDGFIDAEFSPVRLQTTAHWVFAAVHARLTGVFNLGSRGGMSKYDFLRRLASTCGFDPALVRPRCSADLPWRAPRARDLRMDSHALEQALGSRVPELRDELAACRTMAAREPR